MDGLTRQTAAFAAHYPLAEVPDAALEAAIVGIADCVGVMIAGADEPAAMMAARLVETSTSNTGAPQIPSGRNLTASDAAFVNGVAGHALDYDDVAMDGHPSTVLAPAILAEGWTLGSSGRDALNAYVIGYEIWALLKDLEPGQLHDRGFHPTAAWGAVSSAAACAHLNKLDAEQTANAIAIGASLAAGLVANFGTMTKPLHAGRAAQAGVIAARLAKDGFTGSPDALEHRTGFMRAHSPSGNPDLSDQDHALGRTWRLPDLGVNVKRYPLCYSTHRAIDAMLDIVAEHDLKPEDVEEVHVKTGETQLLMLRNHRPKTGLEAKFSMEFAMASALVARRVGLSELTDDFVRRPEVMAAMEKVSCTTTREEMPGTPFAPTDDVYVVARGQRLEAAPVAYAKGSWERRLSEEELREKFRDCATRRLSPAAADELCTALLNLADLPSLRDLPLAVPH
ncbi:MmgE/PrpD family protein [Acuticoccus sediminis]|uniref:MmgE/PrpD family protein n=1 Tax=Acuticoccus sediminis TaxID=2184697 RepID=A0A8B2P0E6_9HYPH|nr:MmgE/PrpD family protein [Acuticoccus sediminis]RAI01737.1 MmgE/PrpD family protein [Acuticoccus sediminis]